MAPGVIMAAVVCVPLLLWMYRKSLMGPVPRYDAVLEEVKDFRITDWPLFAKCGECVKMVGGEGCMSAWGPQQTGRHAIKLLVVFAAIATVHFKI